MACIEFNRNKLFCIKIKYNHYTKVTIKVAIPNSIPIITSTDSSLIEHIHKLVLIHTDNTKELRVREY
jgi:DNA replication initiation complex subunit (GINS family)